MRVRITSAIAGRPAYALGEVIDLPTRIAQAWIADGIAVPVRDEQSETTEAAMVGAETASTTRRRR